jgi:hypothetical protein
VSYIDGMLACLVALAVVRAYLKSAESKELSKYQDEMPRIGRRNVIDTSTLVVGQKVDLVSGCYGLGGIVAKVTPSGVDVQTGVMQNDGAWNAHELLHFDNNGRSYVTELPSSYDSTAHPLSPWGWKGNGTYECGPWYIEQIASVPCEKCGKSHIPGYLC